MKMSTHRRVNGCDCGGEDERGLEVLRRRKSGRLQQKTH